MKNPDVQLNRLFKAARSAQEFEEVPEMPGYLKTRVLAQWRSNVTEDTGRVLASFFRSALIGAAVVMLASIAWSFGELTHDPEDDVAIANYELRAGVMP
jgi:hypothetical protein